MTGSWVWSGVDTYPVWSRMRYFDLERDVNPQTLEILGDLHFDAGHWSTGGKIRALHGFAPKEVSEDK